ncbi:structure-specific endonuclease subunit SLX4-like isoform X1 [Argopecten irradians]|uniref:structure-specific endonuclease subunit SLX4-like isoform X1 n=1 Tax=Argopecten irradians TaxID=31199 RepID=UPI003722E493
MSKEVKKKSNSKLSLRKKERPNNENLVSIPEVDLNETSEFQHPRHATSAFYQPSKVRQGRQLKQQKTQSKESNYKDLSKDKVPSEKKPVTEEKECGDAKEKVDDNIDDVREESKDASLDDPSDRCRCLSCGQFFTQGELKGHIQKCLKSRFDRKTRPVTGIADGRKEMAENRVFQENGDNLEEDNSYFCLFCKKDLSHLNSGLKTQHLNRCMDKEEKEKQEEERKKLELERAKNAVLSCPICGKPSKTENARKVHLKKCSTANSVTTEQVLKLVKDQEEEHRVTIAAGIIPTDIGKVKTTAGTSTAGTKSRKAKEPKSQFDEDTQLAMAISSSLKQDEKEKESDLIGQTLGTIQAVTWNLQENGNKRRKKRKKGEPEGIPLLLALSEEEKTRRQELRVSNLLIPQDEEEEFENTPTMGDSDLQNQTGTANLWTTSSLGNKQMEDFYVSALIPPIEKSKTVVGTKIRRMSEIPGRRKSVLPSNSDEIDGDVTIQRDVLMATTQTAVVLAELAELAEQEMFDTTIHCSGFCPEKTINIESTTKIEVMRRVQTDMLGLVNNSKGSDITILVADREELYAHSVILSCRCPTLLQMKKGSEISLLDISYEVTLSVLKFVYAGDISLYHSNVSQVLSLSKRLDLDELTSICEEVLAHVSEEMDQSSDGQNDDAINSHQSDVDKLLKDVWGEEKEEGKQVGPSSEVSPTKSDHSDMELSQPKLYKHSDLEENQGSPRPKRYKPLDVDENRVTSTNDTKVSSKKNKVQDDPLCEDKDKLDTLGSTQGRFQQEIENFFQDDSFNMSCEDTGTKSVGDKTRCEMVENNELGSDNSSDSASEICIGLSGYNDTGKQSHGSDQTVAEIEQDRKLTISKSSQCSQQTNAEIIPEVKKDDDAIIICSDESDDDITDDRCLISDHDDDGNDTKQDKSGIFLKKKDVDSFEKNSDSESEGVKSTTTKSFQHSRDNSLSSPELIEEDDAACTMLSSPSPSRKRKRISFTNKVKSPVVTVVSPSKTSSTPTADTSGVDLFCSPSPCNKRRKTESPGKLEVSTSAFLRQERSGTRKLFSFNDRSDSPVSHSHAPVSRLDSPVSFPDSPISHSDFPISEQPCEPTDIIDVECMKEVVQQTSQGSPIFQGKVKKKWKFTKTNFNSVQATSPLKIQNLSPKIHQRRSSELSPSQGERSPKYSPENKSVWMELSPVKYSQEKNADSKQSSPEASHNTSIPEDIWDNFDDSGAGFGGTCDIPNASNSFTEHNSSVDQDNIETMTKSKIPQSLAPETPKLPRHIVKTPAQDTSPRIDSDDSFVVGDDSVPNVSFYKDCEAKMSFKTPTAVSSRQKAGIQWVPPSPFTPMPQYDSMNTPQLKKAIQKIGVRPVGKKRMVALLKDVYEKTHQYETDSNFEDDEDEDEGEGESSGAKDQEADELNSSQGSSQSDMMEESYLQRPTDDVMSSQVTAILVIFLVL